MADALKEHKLKLANSRKRFKELQEQKRKKEAAAQKSEQTTDVDDSKHTPTESLTGSTQSLVNNDVNVEIIPNNGNTSVPLTNYFSETNYGDNFVFFDNIARRESNTISDASNNRQTSQDATSLENMVSNITDPTTLIENQPNQYSNNYSLFPENSQHKYVNETQQILRPNQEIPENDENYQRYNCANPYTTGDSLDYPEIKQNEIFDIHNTNQNISIFQQDNKVCLEVVNNSAIKEEINENSNNAQEEIRHSSIEGLKQLSSAMAQMVEPEYALSSSITDLEKRNLELAALLEQEHSRNVQKQTQLDELQFKVNKMESDGKKQQEILELQSSSEVGRLKEELQCHIQTVGMLVAEKTELSASLSQLELTAKQKVSECEELQARLKASRSRAFELEQELNVLKNDKNKKENVGIEQSAVIEKLRQECVSLREQKEEQHQDLLEAREKLKSSSIENQNLQKQVQEIESKLSLSEIKIQQITSGEQQQLESEVEKLTHEKFELMKQITSLNLMLKTMTKEREESTAHYQQYTQELNAQMTNLTNQVQRLQQENEQLSMQEQNRIKHISELERQLQSFQSDQVAFATNRTSGDQSLKKELESVKELCVQLQIEKTTTEEKYTHAMNEKEMLLKELVAKNDSLGQLESMVEQLRGNQPDSVKLLATMESDKVAAARAVQQNKELKEQMEGMKEVVAKLDDDKVQLTEKLSFERSSNKELIDKLQKTELQLQRLTDAIEIKDRELSHLRESSSMLQQERSTDDVQHDETHDHSCHTSQIDLQEYKQTIVNLTNELNALKQGNNFEQDVANISELRKQLEEMRMQKDELKMKLENNTTDDNDSAIDKAETVKRLEEKVKRTMENIADLMEEKHRLEHLVLQLQSETETIGEYVALYQHQRMVLKQKALEKDQQFKQLASDREDMKNKLEKLNALVKSLVDRKGVVTTEFPKHQGRLAETHGEVGENESSVGKGSETAEEIFTLLTEIKSSNLVQPNENFHHCPWCSGQLITV